MKTKLLFSAPLSCFLIFYFSFSIGLSAQNTWTKKANVPGGDRNYPVSFSIGTKGYIGTGGPGNNGISNDFWEFDPGTNSWAQKANFGGLPRRGASGFSIGNKGYIGLGLDAGTTKYSDFWEYDQNLNTWTQKNIFPGIARYGAIGFSIGNKGYIGTGENGGYLKDFWEWSQTTNTWTQKANFGGTARFLAVGFAIGGKGYVGTGTDGSDTQDFWEYDPSTNGWTQRTNFGGTARFGAVGFSIGNKGYIGTGLNSSSVKYQDFYEYNPSTDTWMQRSSFLGAKRHYATGFSIGNRGYIGDGFDPGNNDFWEYTPLSLTLSVTTTNSSCGQATGTASVVATGGDVPYTYQWTNGDKGAYADTLSAGLYMVTVTDASGFTAQAPAMINDAGGPAITVTSVTHVLCNGGNNGAINISVTGGAQPYTYFWANGNTSQNASNLQAGPHQVQVGDASGCVANKIILVNEPAKLTLSDTIQNASCGNADGKAAVFPSGGTGPYTYSWSTGAATQLISNLAAGSYSVMVTDNNGCKKAGQGTIINVGSATAVVDSIIPASCGTGSGSIYISVTGGAPPYTYLWTNGATTQDLSGVPPGMYGVTIYGTNSCTGAFSGVLPSKVPYTPSICIVTVDTATGKNQCAFVKDSIANLGLKQYNFYRETTTSGVYQKLGSKPANQLSLWTDPSANPLQRAWRYKVTAEDSCGNEAPISGMHKTIHLAANLGLNNTVNLIWDDYEGFAYGTFIIYRYTKATGWDSLDAVPSNLHSFSDLNPPIPIKDVFYFIEVENPNPCSATIANGPDPEAVNLNSSKSNIYRINPDPLTSVNENDLAGSVSLYPNPSDGRFMVQGPFPIQGIEVYNIYGGKVLLTAVNGRQDAVSINEPNGVYLLRIKTDQGTVVKKIVLQR